ncbi:Pectin methylesterase [Filimonas lacunae]|uniref:Pectinesterase n=1 Tax=Filimonas lacunae TaxID=477680 RepID=A0A173MI44_9BACT|nr:pectinesterase family protein [Filimonas lacunae]BAV07169.1 rhamnogalacturonan acetylesterase [Filimonas lacunae]SIS93887.1 Pectin methylesterase [Filimonas lacunae]
MRFLQNSLTIFLLAATSVAAFAQSTAGITSQPDTSYTNYSAYLHSKKDNPNITLVTSFTDASVVEKKEVIYSTTGKRKLKLDVFYPAAKVASARTAVVIIHGGGWRSGNRTQHYPLAQKLASLGYVCFTPEYRLSTEALYPAGVYDVKAAIRWVRLHAKEYQVDTSRVVAMGFSAGGELAAFMGTTGNLATFEGAGGNTGVSSRVNAVVDLDGTLSFVHPETGEGDDSKRTSAGTYWFGYSKKDNPQLWADASPLTHVSKETPPTLFINSSVDRMHAGREDYIKALNNYRVYSEVRTFDDAPHSFPLFNPWFGPMVNYIDGFLKKAFTVKFTPQPLTRITVAQDGSGHFRTIQEAINAVRAYSPLHIVISVKKGVYHEKIEIPSWVTNVDIIGAGKDSTIITNADYSGKFLHADTTVNKEKFSTFTSYTVRVMGNDINIAGLTIENASGRVGQAVALHVEGSRFTMIDCKLLGNQDTLFTANDGSQQCFISCWIEGTTDFIFGNATVVFVDCTIKSLTNSYVTAASTTERQQYGYVFVNCKLIADATADKVYLGRPWRANAKVVFANCELGKHIRAEGWHNWDNPANEQTAYYAEFSNKGEGAATGGRVAWSKQLTTEEGSRYIDYQKNIFKDWVPARSFYNK